MGALPEARRGGNGATRVLLLEDEFLVAALVEDMLRELGFTLIDIATTLPEAIAAATAKTYDLAILDVNINGKMSFPVAELLHSRGVPFVYSTGYGAAGIPHSAVHAPTLQKPFQLEQLEQTITELTA